MVLTPKILGPPEVGGSRLKPFQPNGKYAPAYSHCLQDYMVLVSKGQWTENLSVVTGLLRLRYITGQKIICGLA